MSELKQGKLVVRAVKAGKQVLIEVPTKKGITPMPVGSNLSADLAALPAEQLNGMEVEFIVINGQPREIRRKGGPYQAPKQAPAGRRDELRHQAGSRTSGTSSSRLGNMRQGQGTRARSETDRSAGGAQNLDLEFHNPYNFIPAPPRTEAANDLSDHSPAGHHRYLPGRWSGRLTITLTTKTPLLIPDAGNAEPYSLNKEHKIYPLRLGVDGKPYLPPTSIKGMLRTAYEAVTNSRMAVFQEHAESLAFRMLPTDGLSLVPARIENLNGRLHVRLMPGDSTIDRDGKPSVIRTIRQNNQLREIRLMYAAWLPKYRKYRQQDIDIRRDKHESSKALRYPNNQLPKHLEYVFVQVNQVLHRLGRFEYLQVSQIQKAVRGIPPSGWKAGWVCITGRNIMNKHDERVFLENTGDPLIPLADTDPVIERWRKLISEYQRIHKLEIEERRNNGCNPQDYLGHKPGETGCSRHIYTPGEETLAEGTLCYARVEKDNRGFRILDLYPVMISRELCKVSPDALLPATLKPAQKIDELSPADRVFGWANQDGKGAYRGQFRIGLVRCEDDDAIENFNADGLPLAILGQPKPQQARFYVAKDPSGIAQDDGLEKREAAYKQGKGLRGRKVYPHHNIPVNLEQSYWGDPLEDRTQQALNSKYFQEYRRPKKDGQERDNQNRSICGWVKPSKRFTFTIDINNLSDVEAGALLWLLNLPEGHYHRLGGGKPLGFGSVDLRLTEFGLRDGEAWRTYYRSLVTATAGAQRISSIAEAEEKLIKAFKQAVVDTYTNPAKSFDQVPFIAAFLQAAKGFEDGLPIHYPRSQATPLTQMARHSSGLWQTKRSSEGG